jgi:plasmid stabilization system protein ParE
VYSVYWLKRATEDQDAIVTYIQQQLFNPIAAIDFGDRLEQAIELISKTETLFRAGKREGTYEYVITPTNIMVYRIKKRLKRMEILRILQTSGIK